MKITDAGIGLKTRWQGLGTRQRAIVLLAGIPLLVSLISLAFWGTGPQMVPLFTGMDPREAAAVVEQLKTNKVKYSLVDQGSTVLVPEKDVYDLRLQMVTTGAVSSGGFELFDQSKLGATDFERRVNYQRALQEELRRTIIQIDEVEQARVHLVLPEQSVFVEEEKPASASIAVKLKPLKKLNDDQIQGIILLVKNSVEGLEPENITLIDMAGNILKGAGSSEDGSITEQSLKRQMLKEAFEQQMQGRIQSLLDPIFGAGKARAVVSAELDFSRHEKRSVTYGKQVVRSETGVRAGTGNGEGVGGIAGVESNVDDYEAETPDTGEDYAGETPEEYTRNYEVDTTEETMVFSPGEIKKISAAVVVDGRLSPVKSAEISQLVTAAIGLDPARGDRLTVSGISFDTTLEDETKKSLEEYSEKEKMEQLKEKRLFWLKLGLVLLAALLVLFLVLRVFKSRNSDFFRVVDEEPVPINKIEEVNEKIGVTREVKLGQVKQYVAEKPEETANILKTWLTYDE